MDRFGALDWNGKLLDAIARSPDGKVKVAFAYVNGGCGGTIKNIFFCYFHSFKNTFKRDVFLF